VEEDSAVTHWVLLVFLLIRCSLFANGLMTARESVIARFGSFAACYGGCILVTPLLLGWTLVFFFSDDCVCLLLKLITREREHVYL